MLETVTEQTSEHGAKESEQPLKKELKIESPRKQGPLKENEESKRFDSHSTHEIWSQLSDDVDHMFQGISNAPKIRICQASSQMNERHRKQLDRTLQEVDIADLGTRRQTAPEYAQLAYEQMRTQEKAIGNYCTYKCINVRGSQRKAVIFLIEKLTLNRQCKLDTLYTTVSISDSYLAKRAKKGKNAPDLNLVFITSFFIASKLEEKIVPNADQVLLDFKDVLFAHFSKKEMFKLESQILLELEFNVRSVTPLDFLGRFSRLLGIDEGSDDAKAAEHIADLCLDFNRYMLINASFLEYKPSQLAAASLLLAIRIRHLKDMQLSNDLLINSDSIVAAITVWCAKMQEMTGPSHSSKNWFDGIDFEQDIQEVYLKLASKVRLANHKEIEVDIEQL